MLWSILDEHTEGSGSGRHGDVADEPPGRHGVAAAFVVTTMAPTSASNAAANSRACLPCVDRHRRSLVL
ncbi:hypothetical protein [Jiangella rhizosphaerae]|uniref:hypothetical protein n=1 Tax=Jiangella rhizosphaerae TaxID=2293569 RepID=UPI0011C391E5|nr:hypothetical protein [Jiangella rhizosphaerae]